MAPGLIAYSSVLAFFAYLRAGQQVAVMLDLFFAVMIGEALSVLIVFGLVKAFASVRGTARKGRPSP